MVVGVESPFVARGLDCVGMVCMGKMLKNVIFVSCERAPAAGRYFFLLLAEISALCVSVESEGGGSVGAHEQ